MVVFRTKIPVEVKKIYAVKTGSFIFVMPIITIREHYLPVDEDGKVIWLNNFAIKLPAYVGVLAPVTAAVVTSVTNDATFFEFVVQLAKAGSTFTEEITAFKDVATSAAQGTPLGLVPALVTPPVPATIPPAGIFTRIGLLVDAIKADSNYTESIGANLGIIGPENVINTDDLIPDLKGKIVDGRFPRLKTLKKGMDAFNLYADYRDGAGMHFIARVSTFRRGYVDNHPLPAGVDSAVFDYQAKYVLKDAEVGQLSATVTLTVTRQP